MQQYLLQQHVHVCWVDEQVVVLDLKTDTYFGFGPADANSLLNHISGWRPVSDPLFAQIGKAAREEECPSELLNDLLARKIITTDRGSGKAAVPPELVRAARTQDTPAGFSAKLSHAAAFTRAYISARYEFKTKPLEQIVSRVRARKRRSKESRGSHSSSRLAELIASFVSLRPFLYTAKDACLLDSLVLIEFLASHQIFPTWVFGVQAAPFAAHSWVQQEDLVLNDSTEHVLHYKPILTV